MSATLTRPRQSVYEMVTREILAALDRGIVPWHRPWGGRQLAPKSATTGQHYRGVNTWLLFIAQEMRGYESPWWLTYKQAQQLGGQVRKGEKSSIITFWKEWKREDKETGAVDEIPVLRYYSVFNAEQCDGLGAKFTDRPELPEREHSPIEACERIVSGYENGPTIESGGFRACYQPALDRVMMPRPELFADSECYYHTLFHELAHSTGHKSRLNRESAGTQDIDAYGREELIAEMGAALLSGVAGISPSTVEDSAAYLAGWMKTIKQDCKMVIHSAAAAQRAADHILGAV